MATHVKLDRRLDTARASDLRDTLTAALGDDLVIDAEAVEVLGAQCLEVLLGIRALSAAAGHGVSLENVPPALEKNLAVFGLVPGDLSAGQPA